jgi:Ca2+-binding RTX toxin-like protein
MVQCDPSLEQCQLGSTQAATLQMETDMAVIFGTNGDDLIFGTESDDQIYGLLGVNYMNGGAGSDVYYLGGGQDNIFDGNGDFDTVRFSTASVLDWANGIFTGDVANDSFAASDIDQYVASDANTTIRMPLDLLNGVYLLGRNGNDVLGGGSGGDFLFGGEGNDVQDGNDGSDQLIGWFGNDILRGGAGDDLLRGQFGDDSLDGGVGNDTAEFELSGAYGTGTILGWTYDAINGTAIGNQTIGINTMIVETDTFSSIETVVSSKGGWNDTFLADGKTNFDGGEFGSFSFGPGPTDVDTLVLAATVSNAFALRGFSNAVDILDLSAGISSRSGSYLGPLGQIVDFTESFTFKNTEIYKTGVGNDLVTGSIKNRAGYDERNFVETYNTASTIYLGVGSDAAYTATGQETIYGEAGSDTIDAGAGNDFIDGGAGRDRITGSAGEDGLTGGAGADRFIYTSWTEGTDTIADFADNDRLEFSSAGFGGLRTGQLAQSRFWVNDTGLAHDATDRFIYNTTDNSLWYDSNGNAAGGDTIQLASFTNSYALTAADIVIV